MDRPVDPIVPADPSELEESFDPAEADASFGADLCRELLRSQFGERYLGRSNGLDLSALEGADRAGVVKWLRKHRRPRTPYATIQVAKRGTVEELADRLYGDESEQPTWKDHLELALHVAFDLLNEGVGRGPWKLERPRRRRRPGSRSETEPSEASEGLAGRPFGRQLHGALRGTAQGKAILGKLSWKAMQRLKLAERDDLIARYQASSKVSQPLLVALRERPAGEVAELLVEQHQLRQPFLRLGWI